MCNLQEVAARHPAAAPTPYVGKLFMTVSQIAAFWGFGVEEIETCFREGVFPSLLTFPDCELVTPVAAVHCYLGQGRKAFIAEMKTRGYDVANWH